MALHPNDELGELAESFNDSLDKLGIIIKDLSETSNNVDLLSQEFTHISSGINDESGSTLNIAHTVFDASAELSLQ